MTAIKLDADQVLVDGDRIIVVADGRCSIGCSGEPPSERPPHSIFCSSANTVPLHWMTTATEPCETCAGKGKLGRFPIFNKSEELTPCPDCHEGRPIVTVDVECDHRDCMPEEFGTEWVCRYWQTDGIRTYRLTASHPRVVPIQDRNQARGPEQIVPSDTPGKWWLWSDFHIGQTLALPPAATPGHFALIGVVDR